MVVERTRGRRSWRAIYLMMAVPSAMTAVSASTMLPGSAEAQAIKPPPVAVGRPNAPVAPQTLAFKPVRLVYRQTEGEFFKKPAGVFVDPKTGDMLVADSATNLVTLLNRDGVPLFSFGYNGEVRQPSKAVVDRQGRILVLADVPRKVKVFSYRGEALGDFGFPGFESAAQVLPTALTVDEAGKLYVADSASGRILVYDEDWRLVMTFGRRGEGPGAFTSVTAIAAAPSGTIYVADAQHKPAIQIFDATGTYLRGWGEHSGGPQNVSLPAGIGVDAAGRVFVLDTIRQTIAVFSPEGQYLMRFGGLGTAPGNLAFPSDLAVDATGRLYVTEGANNRLQVFEPDASGVRGPPRRQAPAGRPSREANEVRQGLGEIIKGMQK